jgi:hypothetical protein
MNIIKLLFLVVCIATKAAASVVTVDGKVAPRATVLAPDSITVSGSTFTVGTDGMISGPGQPYVRAPVGTNVLTNLTMSKVFFSAPAAGDNVFGMWGNNSSSGTFTVPVGGAGTYAIQYAQFVTANAASAWVIDIRKNGAAISGKYYEVSTVANQSVEVPTLIKLAAGDVIEVYVQQTGTVNLVPNTNAVYSYFTMAKVW